MQKQAPPMQSARYLNTLLLMFMAACRSKPAAEEKGAETHSSTRSTPSAAKNQAGTLPPTKAESSAQRLVKSALSDLKQGRQKVESLELRLLSALEMSKDKELKAQIWVHLADIYKKLQKPEAERAALARAYEHTKNSRQAILDRLKGNHLCRAEANPSIPTSSPDVVTSWNNVCIWLDLCAKNQQVTEAEARKRSCLSTSMAVRESDRSHGCEGEGPWDSSYTYIQSTYDKAWILPLKRDKQESFFLHRYRAGRHPTLCRGSTDVRWKQMGAYAYSIQQESAMTEAQDANPQKDDLGYTSCWDLPPKTTFVVYFIENSQLLAAVSLMDGDSTTPNLDASKGFLYLSGCDKGLPLDGSMQWTAPP